MARVAITGIGLISPLGHEPQAVFDRLMRGESGLTLLEFPAESQQRPAVVGQVAAFDPSPWFNRLQLSGVDRASQFAVAASENALQDAALNDFSGGDRTGVYIGCGMGGAGSIEQAYAGHFSAKPRISPLAVIAGMTNAPAAHIAMRRSITGPVMSYSVACASSAIAIGEAARAIATGELDCALAGGTEALLYPGIIRAWQSMQTLANPDPGNPDRSCRPFCIERNGLVLAEGSAILVLENLDHARARGVRIYAELSGYASRCDASHIARPEPAGQIRTIRAALAQAGLSPTDVSYCNAHGTATQAGDESEWQALQGVWQDQLDGLRVSSTKSMHGHLLGAAGALEAAITALALQRREIPPTGGTGTTDPACPLNLVRGQGISQPGLRAAISNSFAFGGTNAVLVMQQPN